MWQYSFFKRHDSIIKLLVLTFCTKKITWPLPSPKCLLESISSTFYARVFLYKIFGAKISNPKHRFVNFGTKILFKKARVKRWWNWHLVTLLQSSLECHILFERPLIWPQLSYSNLFTQPENFLIKLNIKFYVFVMPNIPQVQNNWKIPYRTSLPLPGNIY